VTRAEVATWIVGLVIACFVTFIFARMYGTRRAKIEIKVDWTQLLPDAVDGMLAVTFRGEPIADPHLVKIAIKNVGARDVSSSMFNEGQPLSILFGVPFYGLTDFSPGLQTVKPAMFGAGTENSSVGIVPGLLKRGGTWSLQAVIAGEPRARFVVPLVDTGVRYVTKIGVDPLSHLPLYTRKSIEWEGP
jgi:hypothetical protein